MPSLEPSDGDSSERNIAELGGVQAAYRALERPFEPERRWRAHPCDARQRAGVSASLRLHAGQRLASATELRNLVIAAMPNDEHPQPSERLRFRLWTADDLPLARALWGDPAVTRWIGGAFDDETVKRMLEEQLGYFAAHGAQYFPLFRRDDHAFVGCAGLRPHASSETPLELGFQLLPAHWKQGLALEAAAAVIVHARATLRAPALFAGHHPDNAASRRVLLALGFVHTHDELYPPTGALHPSYRLALC